MRGVLHILQSDEGVSQNTVGVRRCGVAQQKFRFSRLNGVRGTGALGLRGGAGE